MSLIYWDTMLFVYLIEEHPEYRQTIERLVLRMVERGDTLCTSIFTRGETLVGVQKPGDESTAQKIRDYLQPPIVTILPFTLETTDHYARIRATNRVSPADAIHLASAAAAGVDLFLTNDQNLRRMIVPGIQFVAGMEVDLF
jgi:predicted nucleic acid-binding protein